MGRNQDKIAARAVHPFSSWEEYDEATGKEIRRHQDALNKLGLKYGVGGRNNPGPGIDRSGRVRGKFQMADNQHGARMEKIAARQPKEPRGVA